MLLLLPLSLQHLMRAVHQQPARWWPARPAAAAAGGDPVPAVRLPLPIDKASFPSLCNALSLLRSCRERAVYRTSSAAVFPLESRSWSTPNNKLALFR